MNKGTRIATIIISLSLIAAYFLPIWDIDLEAPQYPEGLGMQIWINKLSGDINTINGLNHYIGMQEIHADSIPELKFMPYLLGFIIALGLLTALVNRKWLLYTWSTAFILLCIAGGIDFWLWEYDYGHNLDPRAAIKIPGMAYQPPLLGSKELLNFIAHSYPAPGGLIIIIAASASCILMLFNIFHTAKNPSIFNFFHSNRKFSESFNLIILPLAFSILMSCDSGPVPIQYGKDDCHHCKMKIMDERFGAEIITDKGKVFKFDATECLIRHYLELDEAGKAKIKKMLVADASGKGLLIDAQKAHYLVSEAFPSPMGANLSSYPRSEIAERFSKDFPGELYEWNALLEKFTLKYNADAH